MKIRADLLRVSQNAVTADGSKAEPEQQQVQRVIKTEVPIGGTGKAPMGALPAEIVTYGATAGEMAQTFSHLCGNCIHLDREEFVKVINESDNPEAPMEQRMAVNQIRAGLLETQNAKLGEMHAGQDGEMDVEAALRSCGFCKALTEHFKEPYGVHPLGCCPANVRTPSAPYGFFQPKNKSAIRAGAKSYDAVLNMAAGKLISK